MTGAVEQAGRGRSGFLDWWRGAVRFGNGVLGADRYERYLQYHRATGCESEPLTEREFWSDWQDWQDAHPEGRCC